MSLYTDSPVTGCFSLHTWALRLGNFGRRPLHQRPRILHTNPLTYLILKRSANSNANANPNQFAPMGLIRATNKSLERTRTLVLWLCCLRLEGGRGRRRPLATEQHHVLGAVRGDEAAHLLWLCLGGARARLE